MNDLASRISELPRAQREALLRRLGRGNAVPEREVIPRLVRSQEARYPLSFGQERLWFLDQLVPGNPFYNLCFAQRLHAPLNKAALDGALTRLVERHEALRTVFPEVHGEPVQRLLPPMPVASVIEDLLVPGHQREAALRTRLTEFFRAPFDLVHGPLFRTLVLRLGPGESVFSLAIHHIIADAWSLELFFRELAVVYGDCLAGRPSSLPELAVQYVDYAVWQRAWLRSNAAEEQLTWWRHQLRDLPTLSLPTDRPRPAVATFRGGEVETDFGLERSRALRRLAGECGVTLFTLLLTAFLAWLHRITGQEEVVVGTPIASRNRMELEPVLGFFANSLVLRTAFEGNPTFTDALARVAGMTLEAYARQDLPFSSLVAALQPGQDLSRNPLFQVSFQLLTRTQRDVGSGAAGERAPGVPTQADTRTVAFERGTAIFDLVLNLWERGEDVAGVWEFNRDLFDCATIESFQRQYLTLVASLPAEAGTRVSSLPLLNPAERQALLRRWNGGPATSRPADWIQTRFEELAARMPDATAVQDGVMGTSYGALNGLANQLAHHLRDRGVGPNTPVGLMARPGAPMVAGLLGVLKAGGAYVPLDPTLPAARLLQVIEDARIRHVLIDHDTDDSAMWDGLDRIRLEGPRADWMEKPVKNPVPAHGSKDPAYILFTSGSTGRPKGVMIHHAGLVNYLSWCLDTYPVEAGAGAPLCSPISSDMSVTTLFLPLLTGRTLFLLPRDELVDGLDTLLRDGPGMSFVKLTPSHLAALQSLSFGRTPPTRTAAFIVGGEALHGEMLAPWREHAPDVVVFNEYGPTETVVGCCIHRCRAGDIPSGPVPIGEPIAGTRLLVLDPRGQPVPLGVPGELYIGGAGVAAGYVGRPDLTAERFLSDLAHEGTADVWYRSGDLVRARADATLDYLGRTDQQVKVRGYRVEPGEIEVLLSQHPAVQAAAVITDAGPAEDLRLVACIVPRAEATIPEEGWGEVLRAHLQSRLPTYMIPASFGLVDAIPLTRSGKVDARALRERLAPAPIQKRERQPPATPLEELVWKIFADALKTTDFGVHDDFFSQLGGHSLLGTKVISRVREYLQVRLPLRAIFESPTVSRLVEVILADAESRRGIETRAQVVLKVLAMTDQEAESLLEAYDGRPPGSSSPTPFPSEKGIS